MASPKAAARNDGVNLFYDPACAGQVTERLLNHFLHNQRPCVEERTETSGGLYDADHRPPGGSLPVVEHVLLEK